jgi:hypothetical protein
MNVSAIATVDSLLESEAGNAVYDALIQANMNPRTVSLEVVKSMLLAEVRMRRTYGLCLA